eukprot:jgi/Astpho2/1574/Aster-x0482
MLIAAVQICNDKLDDPLDGSRDGPCLPNSLLQVEVWSRQVMQEELDTGIRNRAVAATRQRTAVQMWGCGSQGAKASSIIKGFFFLRQVIKALTALVKDDTDIIVLYRNYLLTTVLRDALGNSTTLTIACISRADVQLSETISTLGCVVLLPHSGAVREKELHGDLSQVPPSGAAEARCSKLEEQLEESEQEQGRLLETMAAHLQEAPAGGFGSCCCGGWRGACS